MRLIVSSKQGVSHKDVVGALGWSATGELWSASDDHQVTKFSPTVGGAEQALTLGEDAFPTAMDWFPGVNGGKKSGADFFALGTTDGKVRFINRGGRVDKTFDAHGGAICSLRWSPDGSALVTVGEDGSTKVWSKSGMLRSQLATGNVPVYSAAWSPESDAVVYTNAKQLTIKPLQPTAKVEQWKAHDGIILQVDWNPVNAKIVSGGEDRKYKVWDAFGQLLYSSAAHDHPIMSVRWAPDGLLFAVASFNMVRLCDQAGWSHSLEKPKCGAIYSLAWTAEGTQLAAGSAQGDVLFGDVLERKVEWQDYEVTLKTADTVEVLESGKGSSEMLSDFRDPVVKMAMGYKHLVVCTTRQCLVYKTSNWHTPVVFELKEGTLRFIKQTRDHVMLIDNSNGIQIYSYEGRLVSNPKMQNARLDLLNEKLVTMSSDTIAIRDQRDSKMVNVLDLTSGAPIGKPIKHSIEIAEIYLDQGSGHLALVDRNRDLFITVLRRSRSRLAKLGTMVQSLVWHDDHSMLAAISNSKLVVWYNPSAAFVDPELLDKVRSDRDGADFGKNPVISNFSNSGCTITRADGAVMSAGVSPYPAALHKYVAVKGTGKGAWDNAIRLCRFVKDEQMWACLAAMAAGAKELDAAEIAYAAIDEVDKVQYIAHIKTIPTVEGRDAEMALFCRESDEAEAILLQAGLTFRAIEMNCLLFRWERALDLAVKNRTHIDTVLAWREQNLTRMRATETNIKFQQYAEGVEIDWDKIKAKIEQEAENERSRPGAVPYV